MRFALLALLCACTQFDTFVEAATDDGTVYLCKLEDGTAKELCYFDNAEAELGDLLGGTCDSPERRWPKIANWLNMGCTYHCPHPGPGCNAKQGCYCP